MAATGMGNGFINISISGLEQFTILERSLVTWGMKLDDLSPAFKEIGLDLEGDFAMNMVAGGGLFMADVGGDSYWPPLAASTIAEKQRLGYGEMPPMWRTRHLAESLAMRGAPGNIFEYGRDFVSVGTSVYYAKYHQDGGEHLPRRALVGITWQRLSGIIFRLNTYIQQQAKEAGLRMFGGV